MPNFGCETILGTYSPPAQQTNQWLCPFFLKYFFHSIPTTSTLVQVLICILDFCSGLSAHSLSSSLHPYPCFQACLSLGSSRDPQPPGQQTDSVACEEQGCTAGGERRWATMSITTCAPPPVRSAAALHSHRSTNPIVNCAWEGSRLCAPYENPPNAWWCEKGQFHPDTIFPLSLDPWKICLPRKQLLMPKR